MLARSNQARLACDRASGPPHRDALHAARGADPALDRAARVELIARAGLQAHIAITQHPFHRAEELIAQTFDALEWEDYSVHVQHLEQLLRQSDAVLTENSTTGVEELI